MSELQEYFLFKGYNHCSASSCHLVWKRWCPPWWLVIYQAGSEPWDHSRIPKLYHSRWHLKAIFMSKGAYGWKRNRNKILALWYKASYSATPAQISWWSEEDVYFFSRAQKLSYELNVGGLCNLCDDFGHSNFNSLELLLGNLREEGFITASTHSEFTGISRQYQKFLKVQFLREVRNRANYILLPADFILCFADRKNRLSVPLKRVTTCHVVFICGSSNKTTKTWHVKVLQPILSEYEMAVSIFEGNLHRIRNKCL